MDDMLRAFFLMCNIATMAFGYFSDDATLTMIGGIFFIGLCISFGEEDIVKELRKKQGGSE